MQEQRLGLIGYGEVGRIFSAGLKHGFAGVSAWDVKFSGPDAAKAKPPEATGVLAQPSMQALCGQSDFIISAVTASNTLKVAQEAAGHLRPGTLYLDLNSASPGTKQQAAAAIDGAGGRYIEAGVMTSVPPYGIRVPMLLGGAFAAELLPRLLALGMDAQVVADHIGVASAIKMCRSVMIKGMESLVIESYSTARAYGVEEHVLPTLTETFPGIDWAQTGAYFFSRVVQHGQRRAEEMRECARTVAEAGLEPTMAQAIADKQQGVADLAKAGVFKSVEKGAVWQDYADALLASRKLSPP